MSEFSRRILTGERRQLTQMTCITCEDISKEVLVYECPYGHYICRGCFKNTEEHGKQQV